MTMRVIDLPDDLGDLREIAVELVPDVHADQYVISHQALHRLTEALSAICRNLKADRVPGRVIWLDARTVQVSQVKTATDLGHPVHDTSVYSLVPRGALLKLREDFNPDNDDLVESVDRFLAACDG